MASRRVEFEVSTSHLLLLSFPVWSLFVPSLCGLFRSVPFFSCSVSGVRSLSVFCLFASFRFVLLSGVSVVFVLAGYFRRLLQVSTVLGLLAGRL